MITTIILILKPIAFLCLAFLFSDTMALIDAEHFERKQFFQDKTSRNILRAIYFLTHLLANPFYGIGAALIFWATFDQLLNNHRGESFWYLGTIEEEDAKSDKFGRKYPKLYKTSKFVSLTIGIGCYLINYFI